MTALAGLETAARERHLDILGGFHPAPEEDFPSETRTVLLLGPLEPGFWSHIRNTREFGDGQPDPIDRWSRRVVGTIADMFSAKALFPFGAPPYLPFIDWALRTGRTWRSPVTLLVHDTQGLLVSARGALALPTRLNLPATEESPCKTCKSQPCRLACPVSALSDVGYDTEVCRGHLGTSSGEPCMSGGCLARRACPISQMYQRDPEQSAYHMRQFLP